MDVKKFIEQVFAEDGTLNNYDITEGSNIYELFILILINLFDTKITGDMIDSEADSLDISNYSNLTLSQIKRLASNHLVRERFSNKTTGNIDLHFSSPVEWTLSAGDKLYSGQKEFEILEDRILRNTTEDYTIEDGLYVYKNILVINHAGDEISQNTLGLIDGAPAELIKVTHLDMATGTKDYTAEEYHDLIVKSLSNRQLLSKDGMEFLIKQNFSGLKSISVIGAGHNDMVRDILYNTLISDGEYVHTSDFVGKLKSKVEAVASKAFFLYREAASLSDEIDPLDAVEFKQPNYNTISFNDGNIVEFSTEDVIKESFTQSSEVIGEIEDILSDIAITDVYINILSAAGFEDGNIINIIDPSDTNPTRTAIIKEVSTKRLDVVSIASGTPDTIEVSGIIHSDYLRAGAKFYIRGGTDDGELCTIASISEGASNTTISLTTSGTLTTDATPSSVTIEMALIEVYNQIGGVFAASDSCYIENVIGEGFNIGNSWIKSEHGMAIGQYIHPREAMVISGELVLGSTNTDFAGNLLIDMIIRTGTSKFIDAVKKSIRVVLSPTENPPISVVEDSDNLTETI
jgi:hypothetical protein